MVQRWIAASAVTSQQFKFVHFACHLHQKSAASSISICDRIGYGVGSGPISGDQRTDGERTNGKLEQQSARWHRSPFFGPCASSEPTKIVGCRGRSNLAKLAGQRSPKRAPKKAPLLLDLPTRVVQKSSLTPHLTASHLHFLDRDHNRCLFRVIRLLTDSSLVFLE